jgi:hypothetical protein
MWGEVRVNIKVWWGKCEKRDNLEDLGLDGRILKWVVRKQKGGRVWICLAQNSQKW